MCNCIEQVNEQLERMANTRVVSGFNIATGQVMVYLQTEKIIAAKRGKAMSMFASYCPFCGKRYADEQEAGK